MANTGMSSLMGAACLMVLAGGSFADYSPSTPAAEETAQSAAIAHIQAEDYAAAIAVLEDARAEGDLSADEWNLLGYANRKAGNLVQSGGAYAQALALDPDHLDALEYQGELFLMVGAVLSAEANLARLVELCPNGCQEREILDMAITEWRAANP